MNNTDYLSINNDTIIETESKSESDSRLAAFADLLTKNREKEM